jgi:predicted ATPase
MGDDRAMSSPASVFINYRREDSGGHAGRLFDALSSRLSDTRVFIDIDGIAPGEDFVQAIEETLAGCHTVLVLIGRSWTTVSDEAGVTRLGKADDLVRAEIEIALRRGVRVIPVLVGGSTMPAAAELPASIAALARQNAFELSDRRWHRDVDELVTALVGGGRASSPRQVHTDHGTPLSRVRIPVPASSLVGRDTDMVDLRQALESSRLVTVTGPGGIGKTRLVLEVARRCVGDFADGVLFVPLAGLADAGDVFSAVAKVAGVDSSDADVVLDLTAALHARSVLLVLDNFEHVIEAAPTLAGLLSDLPLLKVLVTSRTPLEVSGEVEWPLDGLSVRSAGSPGDSEAAQLFVARARARRPELHLTNHDLASVDEICRRLDGVPLAIELAAARVKLLSIDELVRRLDDALNLLTGGSRDAPERQRTLRTTIDWSVRLLSDSERALLGKLSICRGPFSVDVASALAGYDAEADLEALVLASLLRRIDVAGEPWLTMLQVVRQFAEETLLPTAERETLRLRFVELCGDRAARLAALLDGPDGPSSLERLEADYTNLAAALGVAIGVGRLDSATALAVALTPYWIARGWLSEGTRRLSEVMKAAEPRARLLAAAGRLAYARNDFAAARALLQEAVDRADERDGQTIRFAQCLVAAIDAVSGATADARSAAVELRAEAARDNDYPSLVVALSVLAMCGAVDGDLQSERGFYEERLALAREHGDRIRVADTLTTLGEIALDDGDISGAARLADEGLRAAATCGKPEERDAQIVLARVAAVQGDLDRADDLITQALPLAVDIAEAGGVARCLRARGAICTARQQFDTAALLFGAAVSLDPAVQPSGLPIERDLAAAVMACRSGLGDETFDRVVEQGRGMSMAEAVEVGRRGHVTAPEPRDFP